MLPTEAVAQRVVTPQAPSVEAQAELAVPTEVVEAVVAERSAPQQEATEDPVVPA